MIFFPHCAGLPPWQSPPFPNCPRTALRCRPSAMARPRWAIAASSSPPRSSSAIATSTPPGNTAPNAAWAKAKRQGLARHIGVANFTIALLDEAIRLCPEPLVTLQAECHPHLDQTKVLEACRRRGLILTAYCPLGRGRLINDPVIGEIARAKGNTVAQIVLRWLIQHGNVAPIPRSSNPQRIAQNLDVFDFTLSDDEMRRIAALKRADGRIANPAGRAPAWDS